MVTSLGFSNWHALLWKSENHNRAISILTKTTSYQEPKNFSITVSHAPRTLPTRPLWAVNVRAKHDTFVAGLAQVVPGFRDFRSLEAVQETRVPRLLSQSHTVLCLGPFAQESSSPLVHGPPRVPRARHSRNILVPWRLPGRPQVCPALFAPGG